MWEMFRMVRKYKDLLPDIINLIELIQTTGKDGKLTTKERGALIGEFSRFIAKARPGSAT